jgi:hypothetical protein
VQDNAQGLGGGVAKVGSTKTALSPSTIEKVVAPAAKLKGLSQGHLERLHGVADKLVGRAGKASRDISKTISLVGQGEALKRSLPGIKTSAACDQVAFADSLGRELARADLEKAGHVGRLQAAGERAGAMMAKTALGLGDLAGLASKAAPFAQKALGFATKNPALAGAAVGAAGGALAGGPGHRLGGALGGAALGAGAGQLAGGTMSAMKANPSLSVGQAMKGTVTGTAGKLGLGGGAHPPRPGQAVSPSLGGRGTLGPMGAPPGTPSLAPPAIQTGAAPIGQRLRGALGPAPVLGGVFA